MNESVFNALLRAFNQAGIKMAITRGKQEGVRAIYLHDADVSLVFTASGELMTAKKGHWTF